MSAAQAPDRPAVGMRKRLEDIPTQILSWAWAYSHPESTFEDVISRAEKMRDYRERDLSNPWPMDWQPHLTAEQTRVIHEALTEYETPVAEDALTLLKLREWFGPAT